MPGRQNHRRRSRRSVLAAMAALPLTGAVSACSAGADYPVVIMGSLLAVIPLILAFALLQRFWRSGLTTGSVK